MDEASINRTWRRRAEAAVRDPGPRLKAMGRMRNEVLALQAEALAELAELDEALGTLLRRRLELTGRIRACHRTLKGTDDFSRRWPGRATLPRAVTPSVAAEPAVVEGAELRAAVAGVLRTAGTAVRTVEIHELLLAQGVTAPGRQPLQAIWNALRALRAEGSVELVARGTYQAVLPAEGPDGGAPCVP